MPRTDRALLADAVHRASGDRAVHWERVVGGEVNEVHAVTLTSGAQLVVRVSRTGPGCRFESERWAIAAAAAVGVPVPTILLIERTQDAIGEIALCVEDKLAGTAISELTSLDERRRMTALAGEVVAQLHTVTMTGFGWVDAEGRAPARSWERVMHLGASPEALDALCTTGEQHGFPAAWVRAASRELDAHDDLLAPIASRLLHGDLSPNHVLTDGERITGLLDFEQAFAGDPAFELVRWDYFYEGTPAEWLVEGYERVADFGPELELRVRLGRLRLHLALIDFYSKMDHRFALTKVRAQLADDAAWFGFDQPR